MKPGDSKIMIENYLKPITKNGAQVAIGVDYTSLSNDRALELYPRNKKMREGFIRGFLEATELSLVLQNLNKRHERKETKLVGLDGKSL